MTYRRPVPFADVELIVQLFGSAMRWSLGEGSIVEVWRGTRLLGSLSGETIRQLVAQHLSTAALVADVHLALAAPENPSRPRAPRGEPRPVPSKDTLAPDAKAARRAARRSRKPPAKLAAWLIAVWAAGSLLLLGWDCRTDLLLAQSRPPTHLVRALP